MKDKMDKNSYQKDVKYLGYNLNNGNKNKNYYKKHKNSDYSDNSQFSWRKGSGGSKSSFDYGEKYQYKKNKYYKYKRNRFNSDNDRKYINNNDHNNNGEIEIDISKLKYDLNIKNKYTFQEIKNFFEKMNKTELTKPKFLDEELTDVISDKVKEIVSLDELVEINDKTKKNENEKIKEEERIKEKIKLEKLLANKIMLEKQIVDKEEKDRIKKVKELEEGKKIKKEQDKYLMSLEEIRRQKIKELKDLNIKDAYIVPLKTYNYTNIENQNK
jgi:hypothetical protein